jgi:hypothetical protein
MRQKRHVRDGFRRSRTPHMIQRLILDELGEGKWKAFTLLSSSPVIVVVRTDYLVYQSVVEVVSQVRRDLRRKRTYVSPL